MMPLTLEDSGTEFCFRTKQVVLLEDTFSSILCDKLEQAMQGKKTWFGRVELRV